jgi:hypothetical protein
MDVSECVGDAVIIHDGDAGALSASFEVDFATLAEVLEDLVWSDEAKRTLPGYEGVGVLLSYARVIVWDRTDLRFPQLLQRCRFASFNNRGGQNLLWHRNDWLKRILYTGLEAAGYEMVRDQ